MAEIKNIVILGAAESGTGAAVLAKKQGYNVFVSDLGRIADKYKEILTKNNIEFEEAKHSYNKILEADQVIKSPGIPSNAGVMKKVNEKNIPIISEIEFAAAFSTAKHICITGTNGKTTTSLLMHHILKKAGYNAGLAGNVGKSFAMQVAESSFNYYVLELSSFQLDDMHKFKADIAIILNITPDHLDRYNYSLQKYIDSKFRIVQNMTQEDACIFCADDPHVVAEIVKRNPPVKLFPFSIKKKEGMTACLDNNQLTININQNPFTMSIYELALRGKHNLYNSMAAGIAARVIDISVDIIRESFVDFQNLEHRLEKVNTVHGIEFINDSKATNVNSAWYALESMDKPVIWIAGGQDKGNDYAMLKKIVKQKVKAIICMGLDNKKIHEAYSDIIQDISDVASASDAVRLAYSKGKKGDVVLLSPACASFDLFENFEDRGRQFKNAVRAL